MTANPILLNKLIDGYIDATCLVSLVNFRVPFVFLDHAFLFKFLSIILTVVKIIQLIELCVRPMSTLLYLVYNYIIFNVCFVNY